MTEKTIKLEIPILVSNLQEDADVCLDLLLSSLLSKKGIKKAHIDSDKSPAQICLHFDPNIVSLGSVQRIAMQAGSDFNNRYRHEELPFSGMDAADSATSLMHILESLPGMLHARVNYAAGIIFVAYDSTALDRARIEKSIRRLGFDLITKLPIETDKKDTPQEEHDHGSAPTFLPHWMQDWWEMILVIFAGIFFLIGWIGESFLEMPNTLAMIFFILSYLSGGYDIATHAIPGLFKGQFDTDVLMLSAALGAAFLGEWAEGAFLLFLFGLGHAGEHFALDRARNAVNALGALMPKIAKVKRGTQIIDEEVRLLTIGNIVVVRPGDRIPVDGKILQGVSAIDQSAITGESVPIEKREGDDVFAGTINLEASLEIKVSSLAKDNTLSKVMQMVTEAQSQQSPTQQFTQSFTAWFVPVVLVLVLFIIAFPPLMGWMPLSQSFYRGMLLLVASSPCALAIGTPASILTGIAQAARNGVLIKGGMHLENLGAVNVMAFDKTGTLTEGRFKVTDVLPLNGHTQEELLSVTAAVEKYSNHPLAIAIGETAKERGLKLPSANGLENLSGRGVRSNVNKQEVLIGSLKLFQETNKQDIQAELIQTIEKLESNGKTTMAVSQGGEFLGVVALADTPRPNVRQTLEKLRGLGMKKLIMLTGDNESVAQQIGKDLGISDVRANLLPEEKLNVISQLQITHGGVAMVGDGVNDAPALAAATVGIAMGGAGTAVALETADVALMADDLSKLPFALGLSRASRANIRQNLWVSLAVIGFLIISSVLGWMQLSGAVLLHEGSTIIVVLNALRLLNYQSILDK